MTPWAFKVNELVERREYKDLVYGLAKSYAERGHKVLVIGDRTEFLNTGGEECPNSVVITGEVKTSVERNELLRQVREDIIFAAISIFKEGISENVLSCVILAAPVNNDPMLEQIVGRVQRILEDKLPPIVVDLVLQGDTARRQGYARAVFYAKMGWDCKLIEMN